MFKAIKDDKIIAINESGVFPCLVYDELVEDTNHSVNDYVLCDDEFVLNTDDKAIEQKKAQVRAVREQYLEIYVDYYQSKPLLWAELTEQNQQDIANYRIYLKDYPEATPDWYEHNPLTYDEWITVKDEGSDEE